MSKRLKALSVGDFLAIYATTAHSDKMDETVCRVVNRREIGPDDRPDDSVVLECVGIQVSGAYLYGAAAWKALNLSSDSDVKFTALTPAEVREALMKAKVPETWAKGVVSARENLAKAEQQLASLQLHFSDVSGQPLLTGEVVASGRLAEVAADEVPY